MRRFLLLVPAIAFLASCASFDGTISSPGQEEGTEPVGIYRTFKDARTPLTDNELAVIDSANTLVGKPPNALVVVNGKQFVLDCIGTVSAIFYRMSVDVTKDFAKYAGNGVNRLYMTLKDRKVLHQDTYPRTGDVVIWDNTWDANGDGDRTNDPHTHAGVVLAASRSLKAEAADPSECPPEGLALSDGPEDPEQPAGP